MATSKKTKGWRANFTENWAHYRKKIIGDGTYQIKNKRVHKYICCECGRVFNDRTDTFFDNLREDEFIIKLGAVIK